jgi:hypothetical protein
MMIRQKRKKTLIVFSILVVSLKITMEKGGYDVRNTYFRWAHKIYVGMEENFVCESLPG